jgi:hypothetical protein
MAQPESAVSKVTPRLPGAGDIQSVLRDRVEQRVAVGLAAGVVDACGHPVMACHRSSQPISTIRVSRW